MKKLHLASMLTGMAFLLIISSCSTTDEVTSDNFIMKRKYTKGFYTRLHFLKDNSIKKNNQSESIETANVYSDDATINAFAETTNENNNTESILLASVNNDLSANKIQTTESHKESPVLKHTVKNNDYKVKSISNGHKNIIKEKVINKIQKKDVKKNASGGKPPKTLLILLCIFFWPALAVALATDWDWTKIIYNLLWSLLCWVPAIIHGLIVIKKEY